jgi:predicted metalloprotease with PDZ domain
MKYIIVVLLIQASALLAGELAPVKYELRITNPNQHYANVTVFFPETSGDYLDIVKPGWRLGYYKILDLANGITNMSATDSKGANLTIKKIDKNTWRVFLSESTRIAVTYQLYANFLERRARHIDDSHAYLDGASTFVYAPEFIEHPLTVELTVPKGWRSRSGMEKTGRHSFKADSYHILASSPIETGFHDFYEFEVDGKDFELVIWGKGNYDPEKIIADYKKMIPVQGEMWGSYPFDRYVFIIHVADGLRGATEHINSTVIQRDAMTFDIPKEYMSFLKTSSHEFVHTWNVKAYRPVGLNNYNYRSENYTDLLWISEGSTSYLSDLLLARSEVYPVKDFLAGLAVRLKDYEQSPGADVMSAQQGSFDAWINERGHRGENDKVGIYNHGAVLSLLMDMKLIEDSGADANYGDLHRLLYERFPVPDKGFSSADILALMTELSGEDYQAMWQDYMEGTRRIDFNDILKVVGLRYLPEGKPKPGARKLSDVGLTFENKTSNKLSIVRRGTTAWDAGLTVGDELLAVDGVKLFPGQWDNILASYKDGDEVQVAYFRRNRLLSTTMAVKHRLDAKPVIEAVKHPSRIQKRNFKKWLGLPFPEKLVPKLKGSR